MVKLPDAWAEIARIMARENGVKVTIHATDNRREALQGADHITLSVATEGLKRWQMDYEILKDEGIASMARENGADGRSYLRPSIQYPRDEHL